LCASSRARRAFFAASRSREAFARPRRGARQDLSAKRGRIAWQAGVDQTERRRTSGTDRQRLSIIARASASDMRRGSRYVQYSEP
jgi:hypothetical protein